MTDTTSSESQPVAEKPKPTVPPNTSMKACKVCGLEIPAAAKKCIHCDSYQGVRKWLSIGPTLTSLLIALVSVTSLLLTTAKDFLASRDIPSADFHVALVPPLAAVWLQLDTFSLFATVQVDNLGNGAGSIGQAVQWNLPIRGGDRGPRAVGAAELVKPGESIQVVYEKKLPGKLVREIIRSDDFAHAGAGCDITLPVVNDRKGETRNIVVPCQSIIDAWQHARQSIAPAE